MSAATENQLIESDSKARFRKAPRGVDFTIDQDWRRYTAAEHRRWDRLFKRSLASLRNRACDEFAAMVEKLTPRPSPSWPQTRIGSFTVVP